MKRRHALQTIFGAPALAALAGTAAAQSPVIQPDAAAQETLPKTPVATSDIVGPGSHTFFNADQFAALRRLAEIISPSTETVPGAPQAGAAEFLDFLIGNSDKDRRALYQHGLDTLNSRSHQKFQKSFADLSADQADTLLSPLREPWSYRGPSDPFAKFLQAAKQDVLTATGNSREWIQAVSARRRGAGGVGMYWLPIE